MYYILSSLIEKNQNLTDYFFNLKKWDTALLLAKLNIPVNNMCLIKKDTSEEQGILAIQDFFKVNNIEKHEKILIRAEQEQSLCETQIKGVQLDFYGASKLIPNLLNKNYNVILVKSPGDRLSYNKSFILLVDKDGNFIIEILGKGFDASDLSKGRIGPEIVVKNRWNCNIAEAALAKKSVAKNIFIEYINSRENLCNQRISFILSSKADDLPKVQNIKDLQKIYPNLFDYKQTELEPKFIEKILQHGFDVYAYFINSKTTFNSFEIIGIENAAHQNIFFNVFYS